MEFKEGRSIFLQIADYICENILKGIWKETDRIPSIREMAMDTEVNPNTVMRSYNDLQEKGVIYNQRGIGYFIAEGAAEMTQKMMKENFIKNELPSFFRRLDILGLTFDDLKMIYESEKAEERL
jgi:GntR family transcriptional regulator